MTTTILGGLAELIIGSADFPLLFLFAWFDHIHCGAYDISRDIHCANHNILGYANGGSYDASAAQVGEQNDLRDF